MGNCCYYLCCGCCCSSNDDKRGKFLINEKSMVKKTKNLNTLQKLNRSENFGDDLRKMSSELDPTTTNLKEKTLTVKIPNKKYGTVDEFIVGQGYKMGPLLGSGRFGKVFSAQHIESGLKLAVKVIEWNENTKDQEQRSITRELYTLQRTKHPNLIKMVKNFIVVQKSMHLYLFLQYAPNGTLAECIRDNFPFDEQRCRLWFAQLLSGLNFLHNKGIAHRDLKLDNILLDEVYDILISDFGLSKVVFQPREGGLIESTTYCGTVMYMAPELLSKRMDKSGTKPYNAFLVDVWSLGIILCRLLTNHVPYRVPNEALIQTILDNMKKHKYSTPSFLDSVNPEAKILIEEILESDPKYRPTISQLTGKPWISETYQEVEAKNMALMEGII